MFRGEKCLEFVFEGREQIRVSDILVEVVHDMRTEIGERAKAMSFAVEASEFEYVCLRKRLYHHHHHHKKQYPSK